MGLSITYEEDLFVPTIHCDCCGERITHAKDGNYEWRVADTGEPEDPRIYFSHKGACSNGLRAANPGHWMWADLSLLGFYLGNSLYVDWKKVKENVRRRSKFGL